MSISAPVQAPWLPSDLDAVFCWLRADGGDRVENANDLPAADGEAVKDWESEVGSFTFTAASADQRPIFTNDGTGAGNKPYLLFDGVDDRLLYNAAQFTAATAGEMFCVCNRTDPTQDNATFFGVGSSTGTTPWLTQRSRADSSGAAFQHAQDTGTITGLSAFGLAKHATLVNFRSDDTTISVYSHRVSAATPAAGGWYGDIATGDLATVGGLNRSSGPTFTLPFQGKIYELIFTNQLLSDADRGRLLSYLASKYKIRVMAAVGDSLTDTGGSGQWVAEVHDKVLDDPDAEGISVKEHAAANETTTDALGRWNNDISGENYDLIAILSSVNDAGVSGGGSLTLEQSSSNLSTILSEATGEGVRVVISTITPFGESASWNSTRQGEIEAINAWISDQAGEATGLVQVVDGYTTMQASSDPQDLHPDYDSGDGLHYNQTGDQAFADLMIAALKVAR